MANHARQQIREAVGALLTGLTTTGARAYQSRVRPVSADKLPCLLIYTTSESVPNDTLQRPRQLERRLRLVVEGLAKASSGVDDTLDTIAKEVETAVGTAPTLSGLVKDTILQDTEIDLTGDGDAQHGRVRMVFEVTYITREDQPDTPV